MCNIVLLESSTQKPFFSSIMIIMLPLLVICVNQSLEIFFGMKFVAETPTDMIFHVLGGASISMSTFGVLWHLVHRELMVLQDEKVIRFLVFGFLCFAVISWEIFEYIVFYPSEYLTYTDTISDMICGLIGGLFVMFFIRRLV